ncbi:MAG: DUF2064 domain-containing protein [Deltaproteobacteria bacterium]|nr:DUF2064 domain-containing protein [Deltaproteobacteria bacterium]
MAFASESGPEIEFCFEGGDEKKMKQWLGQGILYTNQGAGNLGYRMEKAFLRAFNSGSRRVVLFGSDIPGLTRDHFSKAFTP